MTTVLRDMVDLMAASGFGTEAVDLFEGSLPDPATADGPVLALDTGYGRAGFYTYDGGASLATDYPRFQVLCRDAPNEVDAPLARAEAIYRYFTSHFGYVVNGHYYPAIQPLHMPSKIGDADSDGRQVIGFNAEATRNP